MGEKINAENIKEEVCRIIEEQKILENIKKEAYRIIEDSEYSGKGHLESAKEWRCWNYVLVIASIATLILTFADYNVPKWITLLSGFITVLLIFLNPPEKYLSHYNSGNKYLTLKNRARIFLEIESIQMSLEKQKEFIKFLDNERNTLNETSIPISKCGYRSAKKQIEKERSTKYKIDKENK